MSKTTTVRLEDELVDKLDRLAAAMDRPRAWVIERALSRYVEEEAWQVAAVQEALDEYRSGRAKLRSHTEVMQRLEERVRNRAGVDRPLA